MPLAFAQPQLAVLHPFVAQLLDLQLSMTTFRQLTLKLSGLNKSVLQRLASLLLGLCLLTQPFVSGSPPMNTSISWEASRIHGPELNP
jgi:hypothetical protein